MKVFFTMLLMVASLYSNAQTELQPVNAVLKDQSFTETLGVLPDENTPEQLRIQLHLWFVENRLREQGTDHFNVEQQYKRAVVLDLLHIYWTTGVFPHNYDYLNERRPCFIDRNGNICAVGYLIRETAGADVAQKINNDHQYDYITDMREDIITEWANEYGLTLEECAMIQPTYGPPSPPVYKEESITKGYGVTSGLLGGSNLAVSMMNLSGRYSNIKTVSYVGLLTGTASIVLGLRNIKKTEVEGGINNSPIITTSYKAQNNLSYINVAMGTTTVLTSAFNLLMNRKERKNMLTIYSNPGMSNSLNMGLSFTKRI